MYITTVINNCNKLRINVKEYLDMDSYIENKIQLDYNVQDYVVIDKINIIDLRK